MKSIDLVGIVAVLFAMSASVDAAVTGAGSVSAYPSLTDPTVWLIAGESAFGSVRIDGGSSVTTDNAHVGYYGGSSGDIVVIGGGSSLAANIDVTIRKGGIEVDLGAALSADEDVVVGAVGAGPSLLTVRNGSSVVAGKDLHVGSYDNSEAHVKLLGASTANTERLMIAMRKGSIGTVEIAGDGTLWNTDDILVAVGPQGEAGDGTLLVHSKGKLHGTGALSVGGDDFGTGELRVTGSGSEVKAGYGWLIGGGTGGGSVIVEDGASLDINTDYTLAWSGEGDRITEVRGPGSSFTAGKLDMRVIDPADAAGFDVRLTIANGASVDVSGDALFQNHELEYVIGANGSGHLAVGGEITTWDDQTLKLSLADGFTPAVGATYDLLDWGSWRSNHANPDFATYDFTDIHAAGLDVDTSNLYVDGTITIVVPEPASLLLSGLGGLLVLRRRR